MESKKVKRIVLAGIIVIGISIAAAGYAVLPEVLVMQITSSGEAGTTMPKLLGLSLPLAISVILAVIYYKTDEKKYLGISALFILLNIFTFVFNL